MHAFPLRIKRSSCERATYLLRYFRSHGVGVTYVWHPLERGDCAAKVSYAESFRCCGVAVAFLAIPDTPYVRKPIRNCVWAVLMGQTNDVFPTRRDL